MRQAFLLAVVGLACGAIAAQTGAWRLPLSWLGANFGILAVAYLTCSNRVFGKRQDGTLPLWSWVLFFPYLTYTALVWTCARLLLREPACNIVSENLLVGRRLLNGEFPPNVGNCIDLTAEFQEPSRIRQSAGYFSFPILDGGAPDPVVLNDMVRALKPGRTFVHCAQGHGRTGLVALAILIGTRVVSSIDEGLRVLQSVRPGIRLNSAQRRCIEEYSRLVLRQGGSN